MATQRQKQRWLGASVPRKEDRRFLTGTGTYVEDIDLPGMTYAAFVRSPYPHARIVSIDAQEALRMPGVKIVITGSDVAKHANRFMSPLPAPFSDAIDYGIAVKKTRYVGEPVAMVVAEDKYAARDALEHIVVEYEQLNAVLSVEDASAEHAPLIHENVPSNVMWHKVFKYGDVDRAFREADLVVADRLHFHRFTSAPLETNAVLAHYDKRYDRFLIYTNNQRPSFSQGDVSHMLRVPISKLRFIAPDIGGGFGIKNVTQLYIVLVCLASRMVGRPVQWGETRQEHMLASTHGQDVVYHAEMALRNDGSMLGLRAKAIHDEGAYIRREPRGIVHSILQATSTYNFRNLEMDTYAVVTNKCPVGSNRSYGKMQQCWLIDGLLDRAARQLGMDPVDIRKRNFVRPEQMPYETPSGAVLDGGDYQRALEKIVDDLDYHRHRDEQRRSRHQGKLIGIGVGVGMDFAPVDYSYNRLMNPSAPHMSGNSEGAWVKIDPQGNIVAAVGTVSQGQGHETAVAQIVADELGVGPDDVSVLPFDTWVSPHTPHSGAYCSRFAITGAPAIQGAARKVREKVLRIGSHLLEASVADLELDEGRVTVRGTEKSIGLPALARVAWADLYRLPEKEEPGLFGQCVYSTPPSIPKDDQSGNFATTYAYDVSIAVVDIDRETGMVKLKRLGVVHDSGNQINPLIVEGQVHGQILHQAGAALYEHLAYDEHGQLLTASFKDYLVPTAADLPSFEVDYITTPSLFTPLGTRGMGEGGGSALIAVVNAVADALAPLGIEINDTYLDPTVLRRKIQGAEARQARETR